MLENNISIKPTISSGGQSKDKLSKPSSIKVDVIKENNRHDLYKEVVTRVVNPSFYAFILVLVVLITGIVCMSISGYDKSIEFWKLIIPILTTYLGYAIGKNGNKDK